MGYLISLDLLLVIKGHCGRMRKFCFKIYVCLNNFENFAKIISKSFLCNLTLTDLILRFKLIISKPQFTNVKCYQKIKTNGKRNSKISVLSNIMINFKRY